VSHFPLVLAVDLLVGDGQSDLQEGASTEIILKKFKTKYGGCWKSGISDEAQSFQ